MLVVTGLLCGLATAGARAQHLLQPPRERPDALMSSVTAEVLVVLRQDIAAGRATDVTQLVERRLAGLVDFHRMTSIALARNWPLASPAQQDALVAQFRLLLVRTYSTALLSYRGHELEFRPLRATAGDREVVVRSSLRRPGAEAVTIDYDMEDTVAGWKVFDIKVAGVSLVMSYREQFAAAIRANGIDGLIKSLSDKNRQNAGA